MAKKYTKEEAIALKKSGIRKINSLLEYMIGQPLSEEKSRLDYTKKAALIGKWLEQYSNFIAFENRFDPTKNISYKRGDIVFLNFGFGIGCEFGGNHYAVVLDKDNHHNASSVTVIPLSSYKEEKKVYERDVYIGNELYEKMNLKLKTNLLNMLEEMANLTAMISILKASNETDATERLLSNCISKKQQLQSEIENAKRIKAELSSLKEGSVAKIEQIRTVSKIRIYNPKGRRDPLYGIRFSEETMTKINAKLKELYVFDE